MTAAFRGAFPEGEVTEHEGTLEGVREAVADAATIALFCSNRLVVLDATEVLRSRKVTAEELESLLEEAAEAGLSAAAMEAPSEGLRRTARKARSLAAAAGIESSAGPEEAARRLSGRVKRADRAGDLARLLALVLEKGEEGEVSAAPLLDFAGRAAAGDNALLVQAVTPDPDQKTAAALKRVGLEADLSAGGDEARVERLAALGVERAVERGALVEPEVFDILTERGRLNAREFLSDLDKLIDGTDGKRVTAEEASSLIDDRRKDYGSDFVEAVAGRRFVDALRTLERLLSGGEFTAFRPTSGRHEMPVRKGPRGEAALFPILGLLSGEIRRMVALKAALTERGLEAGSGRRPDYRTFVDRIVPALKSPGGAPPLAADAHPYVLFKSYLAAQNWTIEELLAALTGLAGIDRGAKSGAGTGIELMEAWLLSRVFL
jgi:DNA polymerase III delta subunit